MTNFTQEAEQLAPLQTFSREAFVGDSNVPQGICNFVLALALIYNDCKDGIFSNLILARVYRVSRDKSSYLLQVRWLTAVGLYDLRTASNA